uniref:Peptidase S8/S53 domain-containing protein n=1 Tax=Rhodopseudomonas palustris (strain BisA53) TaxID=316055 RepID=Q07TL6_RHOP5
MMQGAAASAFQARSAFQQDILFAFGGGDPRVTIAVLDGPVDRTHECFRGARLVPVEGGARARSPDSRAVARGSHSASVIFGQPCSSVEGIAPLCRGLSVPIFAGEDGCASQGLARAIILALGHGAQVIHVGAGRFEPSDDSDLLLTRAIAMCRRRNVLIVAAAGRDGCCDLEQAEWGASVLAVRALEDIGLRQSAVVPENDADRRVVAVPGANIVGAALEGGVGHRSGATGAAALLAGVVGVLLARQIRDGRSADPRAIREALLRAAADDAATGSRVLRSRDDLARGVDGFGFHDRNRRFPFDLSA